MALAYTAPTWVNGSGTGISASQLQALSDCMEGLVQGSDKAITNIAINGQTITLTFADGSQEAGTASGLKGISSIAKTGTSGLVDTYTITFTDGSTSAFTVTNGATGPAGPAGPQGPQGIQGPAGDDGVSPEVTITTITGGHNVNITDADHPSGQNFDVMDGANAVVPNPQGTSVGDLSSIGINGDKYDIPSGTEVTPNPQGTSVGTLNSIGISGDKYDIPSGGADKADTTLIAPVQSTLTAYKAYAVGEQFVYNQVLYKVTQVIASGDTIIIGTNAKLAGSVTEQLRWVNITSSITFQTGISWNTNRTYFERCGKLVKFELVGTFPSTVPANYKFVTAGINADKQEYCPIFNQAWNDFKLLGAAKVNSTDQICVVAAGNSNNIGGNEFIVNGSYIEA